MGGTMFHWYMWVAYYAVISLISWAYASYQIGKHRGEKHDGCWSGYCGEAECQDSGKIQAFFLFLWPLFLILYPAISWSDFWIRAGANSKMPPIGSYPTPAKTDDGYISDERQ